MIRTRFAPSPTGSLHIGSLRTALYAYALAKHDGGDFILRIEDTDQKREVEGSREEIKSILTTFNLKWDELYTQSERLELYRKAAEKLIADGKAFYCQCEAKNAKKEGYSKVLRDPCRNKGLTSGAIKLRVEDGDKISFHDFVLDKDIVWETKDVAEATLLKSDGFPTYHLAVVVDDNDMNISHVLRGHDWMPSTPIHLLVYKYLGFQVPEIGHLTDILDPEGGKLSKRKGSTSVIGMLKEGYLPEAILNFVILLGWAPKDNQEIFSLESFVEVFDPKGFQKSNPVFNRDKLDWFNGHYIREIGEDKLNERVHKFYGDKYQLAKIKKVVPLVKERIKKISEIEKMAGPLLNSDVMPEPLPLTNFYSTNISGATLSTMKNIQHWVPSDINSALETAQNNAGTSVRDFYMDLRGTIFGAPVTPPINDSIYILGKEKTIEQIEKGIKLSKK